MTNGELGLWDDERWRAGTLGGMTKRELGLRNDGEFRELGLWVE
jgi:hypothetical protein